VKKKEFEEKDDSAIMQARFVETDLFGSRFVQTYFFFFKSGNKIQI